eukprot:scaffold52894_cov50-Prasinocladus_malaysianus.AAC.1
MQNTLYSNLVGRKGPEEGCLMAGSLSSLLSNIHETSPCRLQRGCCGACSQAALAKCWSSTRPRMLTLKSRFSFLASPVMFRPVFWMSGLSSQRLRELGRTAWSHCFAHSGK